MTDESKTPVTRESVDAWFAERLERNKDRRETKLTGDDMRHRLNERHERRSSTRSSRVSQAFPAVLGCALLLTAGAIAVTTSSGMQSFEVQHAAYAQQITAAQIEQDETAALDPEVAEQIGAPTVDQQVADAESVALAVADLQQVYADILYTGNDEEASDDGPQKAYEAAVAHQVDLAPYFAERTFVAERGDSLRDDQIDPRFPWFIGYESDNVTIVPPSTSSWSVAAIAPTETAGVFETTWLNRSVATGEVYAWATADYNASEALFADLTVGKTTLGDNSATELQLSRK